MDPYMERRLREEVIYLHSLWRQGPPTRPHFPKPNPSSSSSLHPPPSNRTIFKKKSKTKKPKIIPPDSDLSWLSKVPPPPEKTTGWPDPILQPPPATRSPSAEEKSKIAANQSQQRGLKAAQEFFAGNADSDDDSDDDMDAEDDRGNDEDSEEYKFFLKLFMEDNDLRSYYEKNFEVGDFSCFVCSGIGKKVGKRFKNCAALVQHSVTIANTKKKRAHRAYGQVLCKILGWDMSRLPAIVLLSSNSLSTSLPESDKLQENTTSGSGLKERKLINASLSSNILHIGGLIQKVVSDVCQKEEAQNEKPVDAMNAVTDDLMVCEGTLVVADSNQIVELSDDEDSVELSDDEDSVELLDNGDSMTLQDGAEGGVNDVGSFRDEDLEGVGREVKINDDNVDVPEGSAKDEKVED